MFCFFPTRLVRFFGRLRAIQRARALTDVDALFGFLQPPSYGAIFAPLQKATEIRTLFHRVHKLRPQTVLEVGTYSGGTLFLFCRAAAPDATIVSIDLPGQKVDGGYSWRRIPYYKAFASSGQHLKLLRLDSHSPLTLEKVRRLLAGKPLD